MLKVSIDTDIVDKTSKDMLGYIEEFDNELQRFRGIIERINDAWKGCDSLKYVNAMQEGVGMELEKLSKLLDVYANYLTRVPGAYKSLDDSYVDKELEPNKAEV